MADFRIQPAGLPRIVWDHKLATSSHVPAHGGGTGTGGDKFKRSTYNNNEANKLFLGFGRSPAIWGDGGVSGDFFGLKFTENQPEYCKKSGVLETQGVRVSDCDTPG